MKNLKQNNTIVILKQLALSLFFSIGLVSCDSEEDINFDAISDPCESAATFGLNTYDPWTGSTTLFANVDLGSEVETAPELGGLLKYSNASTYNFELERYHYYNTSSSTFINILSSAPAEIAPLTGAIVPGSIYSHIVYVKGVNKYYMLEIDTSGLIKLVQVNPMTGTVFATPGSTTYFAPDIQALSITTDNNNQVYIGANNNFIKMDVSGITPNLLEITTVISAIGHYIHGYEYNSVENNINAVLTVDSGTTNLVKINLDASMSISHDLSDPSIIPNNTALLMQFYSTTLNCEEDTYIISHLDGNNNTILHKINIASGETITDTYESDYYFGLESNANN